jgi:uncharacterized membrane protein
MSLAIVLSGLFFFFIIITNLASNVFGYTTFSEIENPVSQLQKIKDDPQKFKIGFFLIVIEHLGILILALMLFLAFGKLNLLLGAVWVISRGTEGTIQIINKRNYWKLDDLAKKYSGTDSEEDRQCVETTLNILESKDKNFKTAQILFSIGTFSYSLLFFTYDSTLLLLAGFGLLASLIYGAGNVLALLKPESRVLWNIGGLAILIYEVLIGSWLILFA